MRRAEGRAIEDADVLTVSVNDFMAEGGDGFTMLAEPEGRDDTGIVDLDALIAWLERLPQPARAPADQRVRALGGTGPGGRP
jgi:5'-nucleotidase